MKKILHHSALVAILLFLSANTLNAQPLPNQQNGGASVSGGRIGDAPASAPVGGGTLLLIAFGTAYAARKAQLARREE